jgi:hypothetical protein
VTDARAISPFQERPALDDARLYLATAAMVAGNVLLPSALHRFPAAGPMLMPILFFTLVAGWRFGARAALLTALLSPLANHALTGMPPAAALPGIILHSALLGCLAALSGARGSRPTLARLALVALGAQALALLPLLARAGWRPCLGALGFHLPGLLLQVLGGLAALRLMARWLPRPKGPALER